MPLVVIDARFGSVHGGLGTYTRETVAAMLKRSDPWRTALLVRSKDEAWLSGLNAEVVPVSAAHYSPAEQFAVPALLKKLGASAYYAPQFNVPLQCPVPFVATVHDLILHRFPNNASPLKRMAYHLLMRNAVRKAAGIVTVSQATKADIVRVYGGAVAARIAVAHLGVSPAFVPASEDAVRAVRSTLGIAGPYLLYIGNAKQHKNVQTLIDAFAAAGLASHRLVLVTGGPESARLKLADRVSLLSNVPGGDLPALLTGADAFVTATLAEGFGLPMIEAMACGCPVLATDVPAVREACDGHAMLVPPAKEALADGMRAVLAKGRRDADGAMKHARTFTWDATANVVSEMLERTMRRSEG